MFYEQLQFRAKLRRACKKFHNLGARSGPEVKNNSIEHEIYHAHKY